MTLRLRRTLATSAVGVLAVAGLAACATGGPATDRDAAGTPEASRSTGPEAGRSPGGPDATTPGRPGDRPNVLMITVDDMSIADLAYMPITQRLVVDQGIELTQGTAPTPICVPARASLLTGQYAHNHGAVTIEGEGGGFEAFDDTDTLPVWLRDAGYDTFFAGKYLNGYGTGDRGPTYVPPGWTGWRGSVDFSTYAFYNTRFNVDGEVSTRSDYSSDVLSGYTTDLIEARESERTPWFMWVNYVAPHHGGKEEPDDPEGFATTTPAERHRDAYDDVGFPQAPEMFRRGQGPWGEPRFPLDRRPGLLELYQQRLESLLAVDEAVGKAVRRLRATGQLDDTYVVFTSDNGFLTGHHNRTGKLVPYDRNVRVPMYVRGPGLRRGVEVATPTTNPDLAVTIAAIAGARPGRGPEGVDGVDMLPYWRDDEDFVRPVPLEGYPVQGDGSRLYSGLRQGPYTFAVTRKGTEVLFDRSTDPGELLNRADDPAYAEVVEELRALELRYRDCAGDACPGADTFEPVG